MSTAKFDPEEDIFGMVLEDPEDCEKRCRKKEFSKTGAERQILAYHLSFKRLKKAEIHFYHRGVHKVFTLNELVEKLADVFKALR